MSKAKQLVVNESVRELKHLLSTDKRNHIQPTKDAYSNKE